MPPPRALTPVAAVGTLAAALFVVGTGAAIGMGTTKSSSHHPTAGVATTTTTSSGSAAAPSGALSSGRSAAGSLATTTTTTKGGSTVVSVVGSRSSATTAASSGGASPTTTASTAAVPIGSGTTTTTIARTAANTPPAGTYTYATSGSSKLFGKTYTYPPSTTIDVTPQGCGIASKWNSSAGNSTTSVECPVPGGLHIVSQTSTVSQGSADQTMTFTCAANSFVPTSGTPGQTWTWACTSSGSNGTETTTQLVTLIGPKTTTVGGTAVTVEQVSVDSTLSGPEKGTVKMTYWLTSNAIPVYETGSINASEYGISYTSNYTLKLDSLTPTQ